MTKDERNHEIKRLLSEGWHTREIGREFGISHSQVSRVGRKEGPTKRTHGKPWTEKEMRILVANWPFRDRLTKLLPKRTWAAIERRATEFELNHPSSHRLRLSPISTEVHV